MVMSSPRWVPQSRRRAPTRIIGARHGSPASAARWRIGVPRSGRPHLLGDALAALLESSREWHREIAVGSGGFARRSAREVGDPNAEVLWLQRQLLRIDVLLIGPGSQCLVGQLPLRRVYLPAWPEVDIRLAV